MASETEITVRGRLGHNPDLQVSAGKKPFLKLRVATNRRIRNGDVWTDGPTSWYDVKLWGDFAQNVAESVRKGDAVIVQGDLYIEEYTNPAGVTFRSAVINARALGPDLVGVTARLTKVHRVDGEGAANDDSGRPEAEDASVEEPVDLSGMEELEDVDHAYAQV